MTNEGKMSTEAAAVSASSVSKTRALKFVLLVGILSFFADFTYEGSRGSSVRTSHSCRQAPP